MPPRWISWLLLGVMAYLIITGNQAVREQSRTAEQAREGLDTPSPSAAPLPPMHSLTDTDRWKRAMDPTYEGETTLRDSAEGHGEGALCGDEVTILLRGTLADGANFDPKHEESTPITIRLGKAPYPALNQALLGMKEGGIRQITAPPQQIYANGTATTRDSVMLRVTLQHIASPNRGDQEDHVGLRVIEEGKKGKGKPIQCGESTLFDVTLWDKAGNRAWKTNAMHLTLGKGALPAALEDGLVGMRRGEKRTLIIPAMTQKNGTGEGIPEPLHHALNGTLLHILTFVRTKEPLPDHNTR